MKKLKFNAILLMIILITTACSLQAKNNKNQPIDKPLKNAFDVSDSQTGNQQDESIKEDTKIIEQSKANTSLKSNYKLESQSNNKSGKEADGQERTVNHTVDSAGQQAEQKKTVLPDSVQESNQPEENSIQLVTYNTTHAIFRDFESLYNRAELIIVGEPQNDILDDEVVITYLDIDPTEIGFKTKEPVVTSVSTLRKTKILKFIKGNIEEETIKVCESAGVYERLGKKFMRVASDYSPMEKGIKYLLFLTKDKTEDVYHIIAVNQGKFNIDGKDIKEKEVEAKFSQYRQLKNDVFTKLKIQ